MYASHANLLHQGTDEHAPYAGGVGRPVDRGSGPGKRGPLRHHTFIAIGPPRADRPGEGRGWTLSIRPEKQERLAAPRRIPGGGVPLNGGFCRHVRDLCGSGGERHGPRETWTSLLDGEAWLMSTNYVVIESCALLQTRIGLDAVRAFVEDMLPVIQVQWLTSG